MDRDSKEYIQSARELIRSLFLRPKRADYQTPKVDIPFDLTGIDYVLAIDDSGAVGPLMTKKGRPSLENDAWVLIYCFGMKTENLQAFNADWTNLREAIREELRLSYAPPIHARLMYGPNVDSMYHGRRNPYHGVSFKKRLDWLNSAGRIISYYGILEDVCFERSYAGGRQVLFDGFVEMMTQCRLWNDINYLHAQKNQKPYKLTIQRLSSPLPQLVALTLGLVNLSMEYYGDKRVAILFDPFDDSQGVSENTVRKIVNDVSNFRNIVWMDRLQSSDDMPLAQAADVLAFCMRRMYQGLSGDINLDSNLDPIMIHVNTAFSAANRDWDRHPFANDLRARLIVQYAIFYEATRKLCPSLHERLVDPEGFSHRVYQNKKDGTRVSMFDDPSISEAYNGKNPT